jgi:hypothetical protein
MRRFLLPCAAALVVAGCGAAPTAEEAVSNAAIAGKDAGTARVVVTYDGTAISDGSYDLETEDGRVEIPSEDGSYETLLVGDSQYQRVSQFPVALVTSVPGKRWVKWERARTLTLLHDAAVERPRALVELFAATREVREIGQGEERGDPVTRYSGLLALDKLLGAAPPEEREELEWMLEDYWPRWRTEGVPLQLALDSKQRLRRADLLLSEGEEFAVEFFDYGIDVDVKAPPEDEVMTWAEYEQYLREECERLKEKGLEKTKPHCVRHCSAGEGEGEAA